MLADATATTLPAVISLLRVLTPANTQPRALARVLTVPVEVMVLWAVVKQQLLGYGLPPAVVLEQELVGWDGGLGEQTRAHSPVGAALDRVQRRHGGGESRHSGAASSTALSLFAPASRPCFLAAAVALIVGLLHQKGIQQLGQLLRWLSGSQVSLAEP